MKRAMGIDPGTASFDLVVVEGPRVVWEESIPSDKIASDPMLLVEAVEKAGQVDLIAGPSGYGTPITYNDEIRDPVGFALKILLLTRPEDIEEGIARGEVGIYVYRALAEAVKAFWTEKLPVCYIPGVIHLPTVPRHRKINKLDMGTADKLAVTHLAIHDYAETHGVDYDEASFILVEMGYGYNAVIGVKNGVIVDGYGGTLVPIGGLTIGPIDAELAVLGRRWRRSDVFHGGLHEICRSTTIEEALEKIEGGDKLCGEAYEAMIENLVKTVLMVKYSVGAPKEIVLSGRYTRNKRVLGDAMDRLEEILPTRRINPLPGARISKEAGQGYAIVAEGLAGGYFNRLVRHTRIMEAGGTVLDWVHHPNLLEARKELYQAYKETLRHGSH